MDENGVEDGGREDNREHSGGELWAAPTMAMRTIMKMTPETTAVTKVPMADDLLAPPRMPGAFT